MSYRKVFIALAFICAWVGGGFADGQIDVLSNGSTSFQITQSGHYALVDNINMTVDLTAIIISADNVVLDLNGYTITGTGNAETAIGIECTASNAAIKNGYVTNFGGDGIVGGVGARIEEVHVSDIGLENTGTPYGISFSDGIVEGCSVIRAYRDGIFCNGNGVIRDCVVQYCGDSGIRATQQTLIENCLVFGCGINSPVGAIHVGEGSKVRNCRLSFNPAPGDPAPINDDNYVIRVAGSGCLIEGNTLSSSSASGTGSVYGIHSADPVTIRGNTISGLTVSGSGIATGVYINASGAGSIIESNTSNFNRSDTGTAAGIWAVRSTITGNTVSENGTTGDAGSGYGILSNQSIVSNNVAQNNYCTTSTSTGNAFGISASDCIIRNNRAGYNSARGTQGTGYGISSADSVIEGNHCHENSGAGAGSSVGIYVTVESVIRGNQCRDHTAGAAGYGIQLFSVDNYVSENVTTGNATAGIHANFTGNRIELNRATETLGVSESGGNSIGAGDLANLVY